MSVDYFGKIKGMKTLKQLIAEKEVMPASSLEQEKAEQAAQEQAFKEAANTEVSHRRTKLVTGKVEGRALWTRERFQDE